MSVGVDIHAFPPDLPPQDDTDDIGGDELDRAEATQTAPLERITEADMHEAAVEANAAPHPPCDYCGGPASLGIYYLADGAKEWACYPCHAAVIAKALHEAADAEGEAAS